MVVKARTVRHLQANTWQSLVRKTRCLSEQCPVRPLGYERVYLPLCQVADTPFHIQGDAWVCTLARDPQTNKPVISGGLLLRLQDSAEKHGS